jgi:hypothetical protein
MNTYLVAASDGISRWRLEVQTPATEITAGFRSSILSRVESHLDAEAEPHLSLYLEARSEILRPGSIGHNAFRVIPIQRPSPERTRAYQGVSRYMKERMSPRTTVNYTALMRRAF